MSQVFRSFIESLEPTGEPPDDVLDALWTELRRLLSRALQRRSLWDRSPSYLGVIGQPAWTTSETAGRRGFPGAEQDALDELTTDFYVEMFVKRLASLQRYFERGDNLEKVIRLGAGQFIQGRQRENDRLGYRLFQWLRAAIAQAVARRGLYVLAGSDAIRNDTVLGFDPWASAGPTSEDGLITVVRAWNDELLHDWIAARGSAVTALIDRLEDRLSELRQAGIGVIGFKPLVDAFKRDVRDRLAALLDVDELAPTDDPLRPSEERRRIEELSKCVEIGLRRGGGQRRTRDKLLRVWRFLIAFALTAADPERVRSASAALKAALQRQNLPSNRQLSRLLDIRHDRIPALLARIREEAERCLETLGRSRPAPYGAPGDAANPDTLGASAGARGSEVSLDESRDLRQELKRLTAEAYRRGTPVSETGADPELGALYHLEACPEPGVEWLVVEVETAVGDGLVIPVDSLPLLGSSDIAVASDLAAGPLSLRPDFGVWIGSDVFSRDRRSAALGAQDLDRVQAWRRELAGGEEAATTASDIDFDPDYLAWRRALEVARNAIARTHGGRVDKSDGAVRTDDHDRSPTLRRGKAAYRPLAAAAAIAVALGAGAWIWNLQKERDRLARQLEIERQPELAIPWLLAPLGTRRGSPEELIVPPGAHSIALLIEAANGDRLEIRDAAGDEIWFAIVERIDSPDEALVRIPVERMPPGDYDVKVWHKDVLKVDFEVRIESP